MKIALRYFASVRETVGASEEPWDTMAPTIGALRDELIARGGGWARSLARDHLVRTARNQVMTDESSDMAEGDEIAFFPPVTGG